MSSRERFCLKTNGEDAGEYNGHTWHNYEEMLFKYSRDGGLTQVLLVSSVITSALTSPRPKHELRLFTFVLRSHVSGRLACRGEEAPLSSNRAIVKVSGTTLPLIGKVTVCFI